MELNISLYEEEIRERLKFYFNLIKSEKIKKLLGYLLILLSLFTFFCVYLSMIEHSYLLTLALLVFNAILFCIACNLILYSNHKLDLKSKKLTNEILSIVFNNLMLESVTREEILDSLTFVEKDLGNSLTVTSKLKLFNTILYDVFGVSSDGRNTQIIYDGLVLVLNDINDNVSESLSKSTSYKLIKNYKGVNILLIPNSEYLIDLYKVKNVDEAYNSIVLNLERLYSLIDILGEI